MENNNVPYIGVNGNWFVNDIDTGVHAQGEPGKGGITPHISEDGYWCMREVWSGLKAQG